MKIKSLIASLMLVFAIGATTAFAANDATLEAIEYTSGSGSVSVVVTTSTIDELDKDSLFKIYFDESIFTFDADSSTTQDDCAFTPKVGKGYVQWTADEDPTPISTSSPLATFVFTVNDGKEANVEGAKFELKAALLSKNEFDVEFEAENQTQTVTVVGGGNTVTATAAGTSADGKITAYTIANDAAGDVDATEKVITKTFEGLTITDATRVYVTIDGENRVFGSDLAEATNGLDIGKLTFGIIVNANVDLSKITEFDVR